MSVSAEVYCVFQSVVSLYGISLLYVPELTVGDILQETSTDHDYRLWILRG
jgi:hypothetical protein